jgi:8-oxo-dGTP pyrophosphatase MutT (NUDIX family)
MPIPEFIRTIRAKAGNTLLFMPGVVMVVFDDRGRVLLNRRSDSGRWALIAGIPEPGEQPAAAAVREIEEETAVAAVVERILGVVTDDMVEYPSGHLAQYMDVVLLCRAVGGTARVNDDESLEVGWFPVDALPELAPLHREHVELALKDETAAWFVPAPASGER